MTIKMTSNELLKEIESWLSFNTEPSKEETAKLRKSIKNHLTEQDAFTKDDMEKAFLAGADKRNWTKIKLTGVVSGLDYTLEPLFDKWFEHYH